MRFIMDEYKNEIKFVQQKEVMKLTIENKFTKPEEILNYLLEFCNRTTNLFENYLPAANDNSSSKDNPKAR
jgi:hypothetical protein